MKYIKKFNEELSPGLLRRAGDAAINRSRPQAARADKFIQAAKSGERDISENFKNQHIEYIKDLINGLFGGQITRGELKLDGDHEVDQMSIRIKSENKEYNLYYDSRRNDLSVTTYDLTDGGSSAGQLDANSEKQWPVGELPINRQDAKKLNLLKWYLTVDDSGLTPDERPFNIDDWTIIGIHVD